MYAYARSDVAARFGAKLFERITLERRECPAPSVLAGKAGFDARVRTFRGRFGDAARDSDPAASLDRLGVNQAVCAMAVMSLLCDCGLSTTTVPSHMLSRKQAEFSSLGPGCWTMSVGTANRSRTGP